MRYQMARCFVKSWSTSGDAGTMVNTHLFVSDPVGTLRQQKVAVAASREQAWRQLASALRALQLAPGPSESPQGGAHALYLDIQIPLD